jgi:hypothetical protein
VTPARALAFQRVLLEGKRLDASEHKPVTYDEIYQLIAVTSSTSTLTSKKMALSQGQR